MFETLQKYMSETDRAALTEPMPTTAIAKRGYDAARVDRLSSDWVTSPLATNQDLRSNLKRLRDRSRDAAKNDPYAKRYLQRCRENVVGTGFKLQVTPSGKTRKPDAAVGSAVEAAWREFCRAENFSASGKLSAVEFCDLFVMHLVRDGEVIVRKIYDRANPFGISFKFYSPYWLDEQFNEVLPNGNRVIMSVEVDQYDRPVAYYLTTPQNDFLTHRQPIRRVRVPASEIIHRYLALEDEDQTRGVPFLHASLARLRHLNGYEEAEIVAARIEACQMGIFTPPADAQLTTDDEEDNRLAIEEAEPGMFFETPPGYTFSQFQPKHPSSNALEFKQGTLRGVAAGGGVSYHELTGDLKSVNYSTARVALLSERDFWRKLQQFVIDRFLVYVYEAWHEAAYLNGALPVSDRDYMRTRTPIFRPRGWSWVDPQKEAQANVVGMKNGFLNVSQILAEQGQDFEEFLQTRKREIETAQMLGLDISHLYAPDNSAPAPPPEPDDDEEPEND